MALPSAVTLGSVAIVFAAGAGIGVVATGSAGEASPDDSARTTGSKSTTSPTATSPTTTHRAADPQRHRGGDPVPKTLVDVFNNSGRTGLAASTAAYLDGAGWNVAGADNWYGDIPADTVYYPPRMRSDAVKLARALDIERLHRAVAPMQFDRLTVILTGS